jgi:hypothetical protein
MGIVLLVRTFVISSVKLLGRLRNVIGVMRAHKLISRIGVSAFLGDSGSLGLFARKAHCGPPLLRDNSVGDGTDANARARSLIWT